MRHCAISGVVVGFFLIGFGVTVANDVSPKVRFMAVTVDDLPVALGSRHSEEQWRRITNDLLAALSKHGVPAVGFVNESRLETDGAVNPTKVRVLESWLDAGMELGNHTYSHPDLHRISVEEWLADAEKGERILRPMLEKRGKPLRYFRHPFLHTGRSVEVQHTVAGWLAEKGYAVSPVTVDNSEWVYGRAYSGAYNSSNRKLLTKIGASYVDYMLEVVKYYEGQAQAIVGRSIPHILLIHAYALNADHLDTLLDRLESRGYTWISLEEALTDPVYQRPVHGYNGSGGITWLHRWAITQNLDRSIFKGEPEVPVWIEELR
jgi:peptidoglycan/xylan/chitin deacetylase (PgdA/CDA1 family)